jgi:predicted NBD/HSP70 family sugar kinase
LNSVGLCVPGVLDRDRRVISMAVNVPGLVGISLDDLVPDALGLGVPGTARILNDARAAALARESAQSTQSARTVLAAKR